MCQEKGATCGETQNDVFERETGARQPAALIADSYAHPAKPDPYTSATVSACTGRRQIYYKWAVGTHPLRASSVIPRRTSRPSPHTSPLQYTLHRRS
jgi:hypothetical protein